MQNENVLVEGNSSQILLEKFHQSIKQNCETEAKFLLAVITKRLSNTSKNDYLLIRFLRQPISLIFDKYNGNISYKNPLHLDASIF